MPGVEHALAPVAEGQCQCGLSYDRAGYQQDSKLCTLFMERSRGSRVLPLYKLNCPNKFLGCCKKYDGSSDGVFLISKTQAVALGHLYAGLDSFHAAGTSSAAVHSCMVEQYNGPYVASKPALTFFTENTWRKAVFLFLCCLKTVETDEELVLPKFCCPLCKNSPKCLIVDGTSVTMKKYHFKGMEIIARTASTSPIIQQHDRNDRSFFNGQTGRKMLQREALLFADAINEIGDATISPLEEDLPSLGACAPTLQRDAHTYGINLFLEWVDEKVQERRWSAEDRKAVYYFLGRNLATNSPVVAYFPHLLVFSIESAIQNSAPVLAANVVKQIAQSAPILFDVLKVAGARRGTSFTLPETFVPLLGELCKRAKHCASGPGINQVATLSGDDERTQRASAEVLECIETGVCVGLPQLRERPVFAADTLPLTESPECNKLFPKGLDRTGGVMTVFCQHGICYAAFILARAESRDHLFTFMLKYLEKPPQVLVYDFGCAALDYCLNRLPGWFKNMNVLIDRMHWDNHTACCSAFNMRLYKDLNGLNSQIAEQCNAALKKIDPILHRSSQPYFMAILRQYLHAWNTKKQKAINDGLRRIRNYEQI